MIRIPDDAAELFDPDGVVIRARPLAYIGMSQGSTLPASLRRRLDRASIPYRIVPVGCPAYLTLFTPEGAVTGVDAILRALGAHGAERRGGARRGTPEGTAELARELGEVPPTWFAKE